MRHASSTEVYTDNRAYKGRIFHLPKAGAQSQSDLLGALQQLHASLNSEQVFANYARLIGKHLPLGGLELHFGGNTMLHGQSDGLLLARPFIWEGETGVLKYHLLQPVREDALKLLAQLEYLLQQPMQNALQHQQICLQATVDSLTGLGNRRDFERAVEQAMARNARTEHPLSLLILDLDRFKQINDTYGHEVGDSVLQDFGQLLKLTMRNSDQAFRLGGDEFVILVEGNIQGCGLLCQRIMARMARHQVLAKYQVQASLGGAQHQQGNNWQNLYRMADKALYQAKNSGRNSYKLAG